MPACAALAPGSRNRFCDTMPKCADRSMPNTVGSSPDCVGAGWQAMIFLATITSVALGWGSSPIWPLTAMPVMAPCTELPAIRQGPPMADSTMPDVSDRGAPSIPRSITLSSISNVLVCSPEPKIAVVTPSIRQRAILNSMMFAS